MRLHYLLIFIPCKSFSGGDCWLFWSFVCKYVSTADVFSGQLAESDGKWKGLWAACFWPSSPCTVSIFVFVSFLYDFPFAPIDYRNFLSTTSSSPQHVFPALTVGVSPALSKTALILSRGERARVCRVPAQQRRAQREVCVPGTWFLQHAVTSLQLYPPLWCYLTGLDVCVRVCVVDVSCILQLVGINEKDRGWGKEDKHQDMEGVRSGGIMTGEGVLEMR